MTTLQAYDDDKRRFIDKMIVLNNVQAMDPAPTKMYGPHGEHICHKVWMVGYWFWTSVESYEILQSLLEVKKGE